MTVRQPLKAIQEALAYSADLEAGGLPYDAPGHKGALLAFFNTPVQNWCSCGQQLRKYEEGNGRCYPCQEAYYAALEAKNLGVNLPVEEKMYKMGVPPKYRNCTFATWREPSRRNSIPG